MYTVTDGTPGRKLKCRVQSLSYVEEVEELLNLKCKLSLFSYFYLTFSLWNSISQQWIITCHTQSHSVNCRPTQVNTLALTPVRQADARFTYPGGIEGW